VNYKWQTGVKCHELEKIYPSRYLPRL
ncbi:hypothetical protein CWATWH0003_4476b4, partial [Crocosphaera watsonii WH 0003]